MRNVKIVIMLIYLDVKDKERNRKIVEDLEMNLEKCEEKNMLLMGGFNGHPGFIGMPELNYNGQIVLQTMERYNLVLLNGSARPRNVKGQTRESREDTAVLLILC